jgi:predicted TIM-barrel fold metal-dependent hydrolase
MRIDSHVHIFSFPSLEDLETKIRTVPDVAAFRTRCPELFNALKTEAPINNTDRLLEALDGHEIAHAVVQARPGPITNDSIARAVANSDGRLTGLVTFEEGLIRFGPDLDGFRGWAVQELRRGIEHLGLKGMGELRLHALSDAFHPVEIARDLQPFMDILAEYRLPILIQTAWTQFPGGLWFGDPIWVDELAERNPDVPIVLTKMGRGIETYFDHSMVVALRNENVYFDTVGTTGDHLTRAIAQLGADRILFGTDWSATWRWVVSPATVHDIHLNLVEAAVPDEATRSAILGGTAARLYDIET